ncbi:hypothetical protein CF651_29795 [Paenibacillus rigui]|uniref:Uncharacterized protein n=1 Tax=Paenibacillus rigui TaxID=554312 RepID=A0A229UH15_9BACL|nr:hypothetical protein CF651_29795 [Paenibacillus rigui]
MKSIMKLCGKLARILVGMARSGQGYIPNNTLLLQNPALQVNDFLVPGVANSQDFKESTEYRMYSTKGL